MKEIWKSRNSHQRCSIKTGVLRNFTKFTGKHLCQSLFFDKVAALRPATLLRKRLWRRCFPVNFVKFLKHLFYRTSLDDCFWKRRYLKGKVRVLANFFYFEENKVQKQPLKVFYKIGVLQNICSNWLCGQNIWKMPVKMFNFSVQFFV